MIKVIKNAEVFKDSSFKKTTVLIENGIIKDTDYKGETDSFETINATDLYLIPAFVEMHSHGCGGADILDATEEAFDNLCNCYYKHGMLTVCPTVVSCKIDELKRLFDFYRQKKDSSKITLAGLHLEGPFISNEMKGAHNPECLSQITDEYLSLIEKNSEIIKVITAAPELENIEKLAYLANQCGIVLSAGHSSATAEVILDSVKLGFKHITHLYSATTTNRKIGQTVYSGITEASYLCDDIAIELIGDGKHIPKHTMQMALKIKGAGKINLTTDSMRAAGTNLKESYLGEIKPENKVIIEEGVAKLPDRSSYAGSIATSDMVLKNAVLNYDIPLVDAVKMLTSSPASFIGLSNKKGNIKEDFDADLLLLDKNLNIVEIISKKES